jgi:branched-chain amino acid transport system permease protein
MKAPGPNVWRLGGWLLGIVALVAPYIWFGSYDLFNAGIILIFFISAAGLHVLVNWCGEISLAQGSTLGLAALSVARLSSVEQLHPLLLLPVGVAIGAAVGAVMAATVLRARGLYVAIATLAIAIAIQQFFFARQWLTVGGSVAINTFSIAGVHLETPKQLYPFLACSVLLVVALIRRLARSRYARAMHRLKSSVAGATAQGTNVATTRALAFVIAGTLAGLAGALSAVWVQNVATTTYSETTDLSYLTVVVIAGPGSLVAVGELSIALESIRLYVSSNGPLITYVGSVGLIAALVLYPRGVSGVNRAQLDRARAFMKRRERTRETRLAFRDAGFGRAVAPGEDPG